MTTINQETGELMVTGRSPRFTLWVAFLIFSTITMGSSVQVKHLKDSADGNARWAVTASAITFAVTALVVLLHMKSSLSIYIVDTKIEGLICVILTAFWAITVSIVSNASNGLAVTQGSDNTVVNGNLYYFSWAGFVTSILLLVAYLRSVFGVDLAGEIKNRSARLTLWSATLACALVVMGSSANVFDQDCAPQQESNEFCARTKFGISVGAITTIFSLVVVGMKMATSAAPFILELVLAILLVIFNGFGVAFITSAEGPGSPIGNLYYFTWLTFLCSFMLVASCYEDYSNASVTVESENDDPNKPEISGDVQIQQMESQHI